MEGDGGKEDEQGAGEGKRRTGLVRKREKGKRRQEGLGCKKNHQLPKLYSHFLYFS